MIDERALLNYSDAELERIIMNLSLLADSLQAGPMSNSQRWEQACRVELARRRNLRRQGRVTIREEG